MIKQIINWFRGNFMRSRLIVAELSIEQRMIYLGTAQTNERDYCKKYN
jgi:hypothetical protein